MGVIILLAVIVALVTVNWQSVGALFSRQASAPTPTELAIASPTPFELRLPPLVTPTRQTTQPTATPAAPPALFVSGLDAYQDAAGLFEIAFYHSVPGDAAWQIAGESQGWVVFEDAAGLITFTVETIQTATLLDRESMIRLANAVEQWAIQAAPEDVQHSQAEDADQQSIAMTTTYGTGEARMVRLATYRPFDSLVAITALTLREDIYLAHPDWAAQFFNAVSFYPEKAADLPAYDRVFAAADPTGQIHIQIPQGWSSEVTYGEFTWVASYYSPDLHAVIQMLTYDDGEPFEDEVTDNLALFLLNTYLSTEVMVTTYRGLPDGMEQLAWHSPRYDFTYMGTSAYGRIGTKFIMLTVMQDVEYAELYLPVLQRAQESFRMDISMPEMEE